MSLVGSVPLVLQEAGPARGCVLPSVLQDRRAALVVAHPGHELRVHGWMELAQPSVCIFTDGSGHVGQSRLESTTKLLAQSGARPGLIYGRFKDAEIYAAILDNNVDLFMELAEELGEGLVREAVEYVVGDAIEGYNPIHDLCRSVINAAVEHVNRINNTRIANFDFLVVGQPDSRSDQGRTEEICLRLDEVALARKLAAAELYLELTDDVNKMTSDLGIAAFQLEVLRPVISAPRADGLIQAQPFYEQYGEKRVAQGFYRHVIRYQEHIVPIVDSLQNCVQR